MKNTNTIGNLGEADFARWAVASGLVVNKSVQDETGWDFIVEFPDFKFTDLAHMHESKFECRVQVKATQSRNRSWPISIKNLHRLSTNLSPSFYVLIVYDMNNKVVELFIRHIDQEIIEQTLKEAANYFASKKLEDIHKKKISLKFRSEDRINENETNSIKDQICRFIGRSYFEYVQNKKQLLEKVGYEQGYGQINLPFDNEDFLTRFIRLWLGLKDSIEISNIEIFNERFGYISEALQYQKGGTLSINKPSPDHEGNLIVYQNNFPVNLNFTVSHFILGFNHLLNDKYKLNRIQSKYFDILYNPSLPSKTILQPNFNDDDPLNLQEFIKYATFFNLVLTSSDNIKLEFHINNMRIFTLIPQSNNSSNKMLFDIHLLKNLAQIATRFHILNEINLSISQIWALKDQIDQIDLLLSNSHFQLQLQINDLGFNYTGKCYYLHTIKINIMQYNLVMIFVITGNVKSASNGLLEFMVEKVVCQKELLLTTNSPSNEATISSLIEQINKTLINYPVINGYFNQ